MVDRFQDGLLTPARCDAIHRAVEKGGPAAYAVRHDRIERTWP